MQRLFFNPISSGILMLVIYINENFTFSSGSHA